MMGNRVWLAQLGFQEKFLCRWPHMRRGLHSWTFLSGSEILVDYHRH